MKIAFFESSKLNGFPSLLSEKRETMKRKPRIAVIGAKGLPSRIDGLEVYIDEICSNLVDKYSISVFCRKRYCDKIVKDYKGIKIIHVPSINTKHLDAVSYSFFSTLIAIIKGYDLLWYHAMGSAVLEWIPGKLHKKILSTVHGLDWKRERFGKISSKMVFIGERMIAKYSEGIIVLNKNDASYFMQKWGRNCRVIHNGVSLPIINTNQGESPKKEYFLFASRIAPEKDVKTLIKAYNSISTNKKLLLAGKGTHVGNYENEVKELAANNPNIIFLGYVKEDKLKELYLGAYAYILPSTIEGQSIGLLEAMSFGLPCLVSNIPENIEVIEDKGYIFPKGDYKALAELLVYCDNNMQEISVVGNEARKIVSQKYLINSTINLTNKAIMDVLMKK